MRNNSSLPIIGQKYHFFDDGKLSLTRHYVATCLDIIPFDKFKETIINNVRFYDYSVSDVAQIGSKSLYDIWIKERQECYWLYDDITDFAIKCSVKDYDDNDLYFVRTKDKSWYSMDIQSSWQCGLLDVNNIAWNKLVETCPDDLKNKLEKIK